jgi:hypothetical protein
VSARPPLVTSPGGDFHVYAMEWYADHIDVLVDGQKYFHLS